MRIPSVGMASSRHILLGRYHLLVLIEFDETREQAGGFTPMVVRLETKEEARRQAEKLLLGPRVRVMVTEHLVEQVVRQLFHQCKVADSGKVGEFTRGIFPGGLTVELQGAGQTQLESLDKLVLRVQLRKLGEQPLFTPVVLELDKIRTRFSAALDERKAAYTALATARAEELLAREEFVTAYARQAALIKTLFPRDRARQDMFFDRWDRKEAEDAEEDSQALTGSEEPTEG